MARHIYVNGFRHRIEGFMAYPPDWCFKWWINHPAMNAIRDETRRLIKKGIIRKSRCYVCGKENAHIHHVKYSTADNILWLCAKHHRSLHGMIKRAIREELIEAYGEDYNKFVSLKITPYRISPYKLKDTPFPQLDEIAKAANQ
jgi:hypothetical protein